ncbi:MAG: class I adenylate-forming enzyme family protein [Pseudohongiellaceae bacterium]
MQSSDLALLGQTPEQLLAGLPDRVSEPVFRLAQSRPDAPALKDHTGDACTYSALATRIRESQQLLVSRGVRAGDRVMLVCENSVAACELILACSEVGAWPVIVNARMSTPELEKIRDHCRPRLVICTLASEAAHRHFNAWQAGDRFESTCLGKRSLGLLHDPDAIAEQDEAQGNDRVFALIYTTGTTGDPKGVMLTHRNILYVAAVTAALRGLQDDDHVYGVLPVSHVFGLSAVFLACLFKGAELVLSDRFEPDRTMSALLRDNITGLFGVPTLFARLADHIRQYGLPTGGLPGLRFMYSGGAPLEPGLKADVEQRFGMPLLNAYGMTESGPTICQVRYNEPLTSCSVGRPLPGLDVRVVGPQGRDVAPGKVGELHIRGPNVMRGYYRNPVATAAVLDNEDFLNTGDLVWQDADGNVFIAGRSKELIIHSGFNVYPPEVEAALGNHPEVLLCAVIGEQADGNEEVVAYVQRVEGSTLDEKTLLDFVRPLLTAYKRPSRIEFRDSLPSAPSGKVLKHRLETSR